MSTFSVDSLPTPEGVFIEDPRALDLATGWLALDSIRTWIEIEPSHHEASSGVRLRLTPQAFARWTPQYNTLMLADQLEQHFGKPAEELLEQETLLAMLASPKCFVYPSLLEWESSTKIRTNIARAASKTFLANPEVLQASMVSLIISTRRLSLFHLQLSHGYNSGTTS